ADIQSASEMGYTLKLLAIGEKDDDGQISLRVHPSFISNHNPLRGAGMMATASAVVADIIEIAMGSSQRVFETMAMVVDATRTVKVKPIEELYSRFYIRIMAKDQAGVFAQFGQILGDHNISISGAMQHEWTGPDNTVPVVITTHPTYQKNITAALSEIEALDIISGEPISIRIVDIPEDSEE
ncbi:MAG: ACT domain-containing protein, partial [Planctomycetota bacterium]